MKGLLIIIFCLTLISCLSEPKKDKQYNSTSTENSENSINRPVEINNTEISELNINDETEKIDKQNFEITIDELNNLIQKESLAKITTFSIIDKTRKIILYADCKFYLDNVYAFYLNKDYNNGFGNNYVSIECYDNNSCVEDVNNLSKSISINSPFSSKDSCEKFIELFNKLKKDLE